MFVYINLYNITAFPTDFVDVWLTILIGFSLGEMTDDFAAKSRRNYFATKLYLIFTWIFFIIIHFILIWLYSSSNAYKYIRLIYAK